tara:strand:+ start:1348 stop:3555 length:2208 start_codon:yes stop_codon:yes gene_type:complete
VVDGFVSDQGGVMTPLFYAIIQGVQKQTTMSVNLEVKGTLAKCLATENLIIEHKKVPTASFDVDRRVLTLPAWDRASEVVYDLLVGHEVGHALYTDNIDWTIDYPEVPKDFVNVLEDVRVERLMKKKYPGLSRTFYNGYNDLNNDDFFLTKDEDLNTLSFIDRINLYYKIGAFHAIEFSDEENLFVTRAIQTETFEEVLNLSREIVEFVKAKQKESQSIPAPLAGNSEGGEEETQQSSDSGEEQCQPEANDSGEESEGSDVKEKTGDTEIKGATPANEHPEELESKTQRSFDEQAEELTNRHASETEYVELPTWNLDNLIVPNQWIHERAERHYQSDHNPRCKYYYDEVMIEYVKYKSSAAKEVNYLVKEFECKKSADAYSRQTVSRTGVLDTQKLHTYKYNEDLFKKVSVIPDGKNHGLIFIFDWSGSMGNFMLDAYKQLLNLIWFCRKVNVPFEVYAFTLDPDSYIECQGEHLSTFNRVPGIICPESSFRLMNLFTSKVNNRVLEQQLKNIWAVTYAFQYRRGSVPGHLELSGSPIGETLLALHALIPQFQKQNKLQKVNVVMLTDGEGYQNSVTKEKVHFHSGEKFIGQTKFAKTSIRNRKLGRIYRSFGYNDFPEYAKVLLDTLRDVFPMVNYINFRITPSRDFRNCFAWYGPGFGYDQVSAEYRKHQCIQFSNTGFDQFNVIAASALAQDEEFVVPEEASKAQIKSAFTKMLKKKKTNKKILGSFIELIA